MHHVKRLERDAYKWSDVNLFLTQQDLDKFKEVYGCCHGDNYVVGTYETTNMKCGSVEKKRNNKCIAITGALCDKQTIDGIKYFFSELYASLPEDYTIIIAGKNPSSEIRNLCGAYKNVILIENPLSMQSVLQKADIYVCPTNVGGGVKLRVMDGLKVGIPVIVHEVSARGYDVLFNEKFFKIFNTKENFKSAFESISQSLDSGTIKSQEIQMAYLKEFSYDNGKNRIEEFLRLSNLI